eukprot:m.104348 g.104348  ORF g.104348 m.104348 type:complete len:151 (-) comp12635_c0_seq3:999-1451(-)
MTYISLTISFHHLCTCSSSIIVLCEGLVPHAEPWSGKMHFLSLEARGRKHLLKFLTRTSKKGTQYDLNGTQAVECLGVEVKSPQAQYWNLDGELLFAEKVGATLNTATWSLLKWSPACHSDVLTCTEEEDFDAVSVDRSSSIHFNTIAHV